MPEVCGYLTCSNEAEDGRLFCAEHLQAPVPDKKRGLREVALWLATNIGAGLASAALYDAIKAAYELAPIFNRSVPKKPSFPKSRPSMREGVRVVRALPAGIPRDLDGMLAFVEREGPAFEQKVLFVIDESVRELPHS